MKCPADALGRFGTWRAQGRILGGEEMYHSSHAGLSAESGRFPRNLLSFGDGRTPSGASVRVLRSTYIAHIEKAVTAVCWLLLRRSYGARGGNLPRNERAMRT